MKITLSVSDHVKIIPLETSGRVLAIYISDIGVQYSVRYFDHAKAQTVYFFDDELELITQTAE